MEALEAEAAIERLARASSNIPPATRPAGVTDTVKAALDADLDPARVKQRQGYDYLTEHDILRTANRIFGFGRWGTTVVSHELIGERQMQNRDGAEGWYVGYRCTVRLTVDGCLPVDGVGYGDAFEKQWSGQVTAHELACKEAESDAIKRAFKKYGDQFGLILYAKADDKKRIAAEKAQAEYDVPASDDDVNALLELAERVGKQGDVHPLIATERKEHDGHVRTGRLAAIRARLEAVAANGEQAKTEPPPAVEPKTEEPQLLAIASTDREATSDEVSSLISLAATIDVEAASRLTELVLAHRAKTVGGVVSYAWLERAAAAVKAKINETADEPAQGAFAPPESATKKASDDDVAAAFENQEAA